VLAIAIYFMVFSFVRTALIATVLYFVLRWLFDRSRGIGTKGLFWTALVVGIGANLIIAASAVAIAYVQELPLISPLLLRGESNLSTEEIFQQMYRPWLWWQHLMQFAASPSLMGWGAFIFDEMKTEDLIEGHEPGDSVSLPTRLLAAYGAPGLLWTVFLVARLHQVAKEGDRWACACFPPILLLVMNWGGVFHPTDALGALFLMLVTRGSKGFVRRASVQRSFFHFLRTPKLFPSPVDSRTRVIADL